MKKVYCIIPVLLLFLLLKGIQPVSAQPRTALTQTSIIPHPVSVQATDRFFQLQPEIKICIADTVTKAMKRNAEYLADQLEIATGWELPVQATPKATGIISLSESIRDDLPDEGYVLHIAQDTISLSGRPEGVFRGVQTLLQLLPVYSDTLSTQPFLIPTGTIRDYPVYPYRGAMLDVSRHFFGVEEVKRFIDLIAIYKINFLHLHLSDDQGWRLEIDSWPGLTTHGGSTAVGGGAGGFYTQDEFEEIVWYAQERYITIIPEIDMPGHTNAALASYPELNCDGKAPELYTGTRVGFSSLCTSKEVTYQFVDDVIRELAAITPGPYIHIGGDESHETSIEDYIRFMNRVQGIVRKYDKKVIGWDEIAHAKLADGSVVQHWAEAKNATKAVEQGAKLIMSPATKTYLDMQYDSTTVLGQNWASYIEVDDAYKWDPALMIAGIDQEHVLGVEAPLWTETISTMDEIEYMLFPRLAGIAEIGWTPAENRKWDEYKTRLGDHALRLAAMGVNFYASEKVPWGQATQEE